MLTNKEIVETYIVRYPKAKEWFDNTTVGSERWRDDLWGEVILVMLEYDNEELNNRVEQGEDNILYLFIRIVKLQLHSSESPFWYKYRNKHSKTTYLSQTHSPTSLLERSHERTKHEGYNEEWESEYNEHITDIMKHYDDILQNLSFYERELWKLYVDCGAGWGSYTEMNQRTNIPVESIGKTIRDVKRYLEGHLKHNIDRHI